MHPYIALINQLFEIEQKLNSGQLGAQFERNFKRIKHTLEQEGYFVLDPKGESYSDSRTDYEANIVGEENAKLIITKVVKPIIYKESAGVRQLVQKGIVIAE